MRGCFLLLWLVIPIIAAVARAEDCNTNSFEDGGEITFLNGYALDFAADDYVGIAPNSIYNLVHKFTIEAWIRPDSVSGLQRIVSNRDNAGGFGFGRNGGKLRFTYFAVKDYDTVQSYLTAGVWTHVAVVLDDTEDAHFYVNAQWVETIAGNTQGNPSAKQLNIGRNPSNTEYWDGAIDEVRVWNYKRTDQEIEDNYDQWLQGDELALVGYWRMDEGSGNTLNDLSDHSDGTIMGATWISSISDDCNTNRLIDVCEIADGLLPDCNANAVPDVCDFAQTFAQEISVPIPDAGQSVSTPPITIGMTAPITDLNVGLEVDYTFIPDLQIKLTNGATTVTLVNGDGELPGDFHKTLFDDEATQTINEGDPPYIGSWIPGQALSAFDGTQGLKNWSLILTDLDPVEDWEGELLSWHVSVATTDEVDCDTDGVPDSCEPDCDTDGISDDCDGEAIVKPGPGGAIPDYQNPPLEKSVMLTEAVDVADVNVTININHPATAELTLSISHAGVTVPLATHKNGTGYVGTTFDDEAYASIYDTPSGPHSGSYQPEGQLWDFDGLTAAGQWTLTVDDDLPLDTGTLLNWTLSILGASDCDTNDVPDYCEEQDCNTNGTPDACEPLEDCNTNAVPDECELDDCNTDGLRDLCQADYSDCDINSVFDFCDVDAGTAADCNSNGRPDLCDLYVSVGPVTDAVRAVDLAFPDLVETTDSLTIDDAAPFDDLEVSLVVTHPFMGDTQYWLDHNGTSIPLMYNFGMDSDNADILFDDDAQAAPPVEGPLVGTYLPQWPLESLIPGGNSTGEWTVHCLDIYDGSGSGVLNQWAVHLSAVEFVSDDCNTNTLPDECEVDCNTNQIHDACEELGDCNTNGQDDVCETTPNITYDSGVLAPIFGGITRTYTFTPVEAHSDVTLEFDVLAAINCFLGHYIYVHVNGDYIGQIDCWQAPFCVAGTAVFVIPKDDFNAAYANMPATITMAADADMQACGGNSYIRALVSFDPNPTSDCDTNGVPDECQAQDDTCNPNGVPDVCDADCDTNGVGDACEGGCNTNGVPDACEGGCNTNGVPDECEVLAGSAADCNTDGLVDICFLDETLADQPPVFVGYFAMDTSDSGYPELSAKQWDQVVLPAQTHIWNGTATFWPETWSGFETVPFLVEISTAPGGAEAGGEVVLSATGWGRSDGSGVVDFDLGGAALPAGTWWISVQATGGLLEHGDLYYYVNPGLPDATKGFYFHNPGGGWGLGTDPAFIEGFDLAFSLYTVVDCNTNMVPDVCEEDCNGNGRHDDCDPDYGDCNTNGVEDSCELNFADCNTNLVKDECDIASGNSTDCNTNGVPQECDDSDCNTNGIADACDISSDTAMSGDCDTNNVPDECDGDCDTNGIGDACDIASGEADCNTNGVPDLCDVFPFDGYAVQFMSADSHMQVQAAPELDMEAALTMEAWLFPMGRGGHPSEGGIILCKEGEYALARFPDGGIRFSFANSDGWGWRYTPATASDGQWTHVALTYNGSAIRTYQNGQLLGIGGGVIGAIGDAIPEFNDLLIGNRQALPAAFDGRIDEVRVWNVVRSDSEIQSNYNKPLTGSEPGLIGYWRFDEGSGTVAADSAGEDHNGTLANEAIWSPLAPDCNTNGVPDECDLADGVTQDCNTNGVPDACDGDCNGDGLADLCNITSGSSQDCNTNLEADDCEGDCNTNDIPDPCEPDCNTNGYPDDCEGGCNTNGIPDECEADCNTNEVADACDIGSGSSADCNTNAVPDECELRPAAELSDYSHNVGSLFTDLLADSIVVEQSAPFDDLNVEIAAYDPNMWHTYFSLSRGETHVILMAQAGGETDFAFVLLDDEAASDPPDVGPLIGTFKPIQSLTSFKENQNQAGTWTLYAQDLYGGTGYLQSWSLHFSYTPAGLADCNTNEAPDQCDLGSDVATDCNTNGALDDCDMAAPFLLNTAVSSPNLAVPDFAEVTDSISINEPAAFDDLNVALVVTHPFVNELVVRLDKAGTTIDLLFGTGNSANCVVLLDDEAAAPPPSDGPMIGTFQPIQPLSSFDPDGQQTGTWTLHCIDTLPNDVSGVLEEWTLHFGWQSDDCNTNGAPDECDLADGESSDSNGDGVPDECGESIAGDLNCDGVVDAADVPLFVQALLDPAAFDGCDIARADLNSDSLIDGADVQPFANIVFGP